MKGSLLFPLKLSLPEGREYEAKLGLIYVDEPLLKELKPKASRLKLRETMVEARQKEILGSYVLVKDMLKDLLGKEISDDMIETEESPWGFKEVFAEGFSNDWGFSFSHKKGYVVAICSKRIFPMGVDLEMAEASKIRAFRRYVSDEEAAFLSGLAPEDQAAILFSAKEAVSKVVRLGFSVSKSIYDVSSVERMDVFYRVHFKRLYSLKVDVFFQKPFVLCLSSMKNSSLRFDVGQFSSFLKNIVL